MSDLGNGVWLFVLFSIAFVVIVTIGFVRRDKQAKKLQNMMGADTVSLPGWTEGETTRLLSSAEQPGFYMLRPRFLSKLETIAFQHLKRALPQHEILARIRVIDLLQLATIDEAYAREEAFRRIAFLDVSFVVCDGDMVIIAIIDLDDPAVLSDAARLRLHKAKQSALKTAHANYFSFDPLHPPTEEELRHLVLAAQTMVA
ncbi:MAG: DUF2726 domain-containing protein [Burkholderiales bacterium]|jgi:hypothetical protein|nr:DUF2726 domain-containing protein [Burkholderiales bacterium]